MSKGKGKKIAVKFTENLIGDVGGNQQKFTIEGKEPLYVKIPSGELGPLVDKVYEVESVERYPVVTLHAEDFLGGTASGVIANENGLALENIQASMQVFTQSGAFTVPEGVDSVDVLVVGGGGGGGGFGQYTNGAGGGGAGGVIRNNNYTVTPGAVLLVTIGNGGAGGNSSRGANGGNSVFDELVAIGGGGGEGWASTYVLPTYGGSGGGAAGSSGSRSGAPGEPGQGHAGGNVSGGGGATAAGVSVTANEAGAGGAGYDAAVFGVDIGVNGWVGGGGGGGRYGGTAGSGGQGGGGAGNSGGNGYSATANTGGGGGGSGGAGTIGGNGGAGVVVVIPLQAGPVTGNYIAAPLDLSSLPGGLRIKWEGQTPAGSSVSVETAVNEDALTVPTEWAEQISGEVIYNIPAGDLTGKYLWIRYTLLAEGTTESPTVTALWIEEASAPQNIILLTMKPMAHFRNAEGHITAKYNMVGGTIEGVGGPVASFDKDFMPEDLARVPNPLFEEIITVSITDFQLLLTRLNHLVVGDGPWPTADKKSQKWVVPPEPPNQGTEKGLWGSANNEKISIGITGYTITLIPVGIIDP